MDLNNVKYIFLFLFVLLTAGCVSKGHEKERIGLIISSLGDKYHISLKDGVYQEGKHMGYNVAFFNSKHSSNREAKGISELYKKGIQVIILNSISKNTLRDAVKYASEKNIKLVTIGKCDKNRTLNPNICSSDYLDGKEIGLYLKSRLEGEGDILQVSNTYGNRNIKKIQGFDDAIKNTNIKSISMKNRLNNINQLQKNIQSKLDIYPSISAIIVPTNLIGLSLGYKLNKKNIFIMSLGVSQKPMYLIFKGRIYASFKYQPQSMGKLAVKLATNLLSGRQITRSNIIPIKFTKTKILYFS